MRKNEAFAAAVVTVKVKVEGRHFPTTSILNLFKKAFMIILIINIIIILIINIIIIFIINFDRCRMIWDDVNTCQYKVID